MASVFNDSTKPLTFNEWYNKTLGILPIRNFDIYKEYLKDWYATKSEETTNNSNVTRDQFVQLLQDLNYLFTENENSIIQNVDFNKTEDLIYVIPFYAKKLKEIARVLSVKRQSVKNTKLKYNLIGSNLGLEKLLYEYLLKNFTVRDHSLTQVPTSELQSLFPALSSINQNFFIEVEELYDQQNYADSDPSVEIADYVSNLLELENNTIFNGLSEDQIIELFQARFLNRVINDPLSVYFNDLLTNPNSDIQQAVFDNSVELFDYAQTNAELQALATRKFLGSKIYSITAISSTDDITPDAILNLPFKTGNNWFLWPSGYKIVNSGEFINYFQPITINDSSLISSGATASASYLDSDLLFTEKNGEVEGAWLQGIRESKFIQTFRVQLPPGTTREFIYPFPGVNLTQKGSNWNEYNTIDDFFFDFNLLGKEQQKTLLESYYTSSLPLSSANSIKINQTQLVDSGAKAAIFSTESDYITRRNLTSSVNVYSDQLDGPLEKAFLYKITKTDIPIKEGLNYVYWPLLEYTESNDINITITNEYCSPVRLVDVDPAKAFNGAIGGLSFNSGDIIYRLNARTLEPIEAAWLQTSDISNLLIENTIPVYSNDAVNCEQFLEGPIQNSLSFICKPLEKISFVWCGSDTLADDVFKYHEHAADCPYYQTQPHQYYTNQDYVNINPLSPDNYWEKCTCKAVHFSPAGHNGSNFLEYNMLTDLLFADPQGLGEDFAINSWMDTRGLNPLSSPQFGYFQLDGLIGDQIVGYGSGSWRTGDGSSLVLKTGKRYTYYRTSLRRDASSQRNTDDSFPLLVSRYQYPEVKLLCHNACSDNVLVIDLSKSESLSIEDIKNLSLKLIQTLLGSGDNQVAIIAFNNSAAVVSYLSSEQSVLEFYVQNLNIPTNYPGYRTNIKQALEIASYILTTNIPDVDNSDLNVLCSNKNLLILSPESQTLTINKSRPDCIKNIFLISDGNENEGITNAPTTEEVAYNISLSGISIVSVDIGYDSTGNTLMEDIASNGLYFDYEKYVNFNEGGIGSFAQVIINSPIQCQGIIPTWYKAIRNAEGDWEASNEISDMILYPGDFLSYVHQSGIPYNSENSVSNFDVPNVPFSINVKLKGWDYNTNTSNLTAVNNIGCKPFWGKASTIPNDYFNKETESFGGQIRFVYDYVPITQPEVSDMVLHNGDFVTYYRRSSDPLVWSESLNFVYTDYTKQWNKLLFTIEPSSLVDLLENGISNKVVYQTNEPSDILLESYSQFAPARYNYFARGGYQYNQNLFYAVRDDSSFSYMESAVILPDAPYNNLTNVFYPTLQITSNPGLLNTKKEIGGFLLPENLGIPYYLGKGYTLEVDTTKIQSNSLSADNIFNDPTKYGPYNQGLTQKSQNLPVKVTDIDYSWIYEDSIQNSRTGIIKDTLKTQKFTPYQSQFELLGFNDLGLSVQGDEFEYLNQNGWNTNIFLPQDFDNNGNLLPSALSAHDVRLLVNKGTLTHWGVDIYNNNFGIYKKEANSLTLKNSLSGEFWIRTNQKNIQPSNVLLSAVYVKYQNTAIYPQLTANQFTSLDCYYDTLFLSTLSGFLIERISYNSSSDYFSNSDNTVRYVQTDSFDYWFLEDPKQIQSFTCSINGNGVLLTGYLYDFTTDTFNTNLESTIDLTGFVVGSIDPIKVSYSAKDKMYSINTILSGSLGMGLFNAFIGKTLNSLEILSVNYVLM